MATETTVKILWQLEVLNNPLRKGVKVLTYICCVYLITFKFKAIITKEDTLLDVDEGVDLKADSTRDIIWCN
jgi:hypothetical protein